jgi:hypothetical protein
MFVVWMLFTRAATALVVLAIAIGAASCRRAADIGAPLTLEEIALPSPPGSGMPQITATGDRAILSWLEIAPAGATLKFAERTANGWSEPRTVASGTDWFVNAADVPSVLRLGDGTLAAHWLTETDPHREAYDVHLAFSHDGGRTWTPPTSPHHDGTRTQHGFVSLFELPGSRLGLAWLDGRQTDNPENDNMSVRAAVFDRRDTQISEALVDDRVCDCCPTSAAATSSGPLIAYRDRSGDEIRDITVSRLEHDKWSPPRIVHDDGWKIEACPVNGPALAADGRHVAIAWFTAAGDQGRAFAAFSEDAGDTFGAPIRVDDEGSTGRVGVALTDDGSAIVSWMQLVDKRATLRFRRVARTGGRGPAQNVHTTEGSRPTGYPRLVRRGSEILFAWTEQRGEEPTTVRTAAARISKR